MTFPVQFPNNIYSFTATCADNTGAAGINISAGPTTTSATKRPIYWMAIGN